MNSKLTPHIAAMYWGSKILHDTAGTVTVNGNHVSLLENGFLKGAQLLLTPLSEISDEDALKVGKILFAGDEEITISVTRFADKAHIVINDSIEIVITNEGEIVAAQKETGDYLPTMFVAEFINFMRSKSYDCDGFIEQGIAVKHSESPK